MGTILFNKAVGALPNKGIGGYIKKDRLGNIIRTGTAFDDNKIQNDIKGAQQFNSDAIQYTDNSGNIKDDRNPSDKEGELINVKVFGENISDAYGKKSPGEFALEVLDEDGNIATDRKTGEKLIAKDKDDTVPSLMNGFAVIYHKACEQDTTKWRDLGTSQAFPKENRRPTIEGLLNDFSRNLEWATNETEANKLTNERYPTPYYAADFMYAKYYAFIPLNRLITLRRYPHPTHDNLKWGGKRSFKPIAQAITYMGEPTGNDMESIMKIKGKLNWKELESEVNVVTGDTVAGYENTPFSGLMGNFGRAVSVLTGKGDLSQKQEEANQYAARYTTEDYTRKPYGPINSIVKTTIRDRGLEANMSFQLTFEYTLRSYANINPRLAMMDVICNMLALTFNHAKFWGGANRFFPNSPQYAFLGDQEAFYRGDYGTYLQSFVDDMSKGILTGFDMLKNVVNSIMNMDFSSALSQIVKTVGGVVLDQKAAKNRPQLVGFKALLSSEPTGEWHMTVGNPYRPMMKMGNLIVKDWEMTHSGHIGIDDFPSNLKFVINVEQGMPRDKAAVESIYNYGDGKMYYKPVIAGTEQTNASKEKVRIISTSGKGTGKNNKEEVRMGLVANNKAGYGQQAIKNVARNVVTPEILKKLSGTLF